MPYTKICCFTGHRKIDGDAMAKLSPLLDRIIDRLIADGVEVFRTGGAIGFDTLAALKIIELKRLGRRIRLELVLPCKNQSDLWSDEDKRFYGYILENADSVIYARESYTRGCMLERNRMLVDGSCFCIGYCTTETGGSAYTLNYAKKKNLRVINLASLI